MTTVEKSKNNQHFTHSLVFTGTSNKNSHNAFQTKMRFSNLGKFRTILVFAAEKFCSSERFGKLEGEK